MGKGGGPMRTFGILLLLASAAPADRILVSFRVKGDEGPPLRGWCVEATPEGFTFQRFGAGRRDFVPWDRVHEEDVGDLRRRLRLEPDEDEQRGLVAGHRLLLEGGGSVEGLLVRVDEDERHWLKSGGVLLPYPRDRVAGVEEVRVLEADVYDEHEIYLRRIERRRPTSALEHRELADRMFEIGNYEKAAEHYAEALSRMPSWRPDLEPRLAEIREVQEDADLRRAVQAARTASTLHGDHEKACALIQAYALAHPERRRAALRVLDEVDARRFEDMRLRFHRVKVEEMDRVLRDYVVRRAPAFDEATSWVTVRLEEAVREAIRERMGLTDDEARDLAATRSTGAPHWAGYWTGSFILSSRAKQGAHTDREPVGDKDRWWAAYGDVGPRVSFLRAYAAERLPALFEVVQVKTPPCEACGGTGRIRHVSVKPLAAGGHEFTMRCHRCFGACQDRVVAFR